MKFRTQAYFVFAAIVGSTLNPVMAQTPSTPASFSVNPDSLRHQLLENNLSLEAALNQVQDAKDRVSLARMTLLPAVSLGGSLNLAGAPTFLLSSVQSLLPFLLPSTWFNLFEQKSLYQAQILSYKILELNTYASALSLYYQILSDQQKKSAYDQQAQDFSEMQKVLEGQQKDLGIVSKEDVERAQAQAQLSQVQASHFAELMDQEIAALRAALGLPLEVQVTLDSSMVAASDSESGSIEDAVKKAESLSPELMQIQYLISAAKSDRWSKTFGFMGNATIGSQVAVGSSTPASFGNLRANGSMTLGLGLIPTIRLASRNISEIQLQDSVVRQQTTQVLEATLKSIQEAKQQLDLATLAEKELVDVYEGKLEQQELGLCSYLTVLYSRTQLTNARIARIQAETDLNELRISLHRALGSSSFSQVKQCTPKTALKSVLGKKLSEVCEELSQSP